MTASVPCCRFCGCVLSSPAEFAFVFSAAEVVMVMFFLAAVDVQGGMVPVGT